MQQIEIESCSRWNSVNRNHAATDVSSQTWSAGSPAAPYFVSLVTLARGSLQEHYTKLISAALLRYLYFNTNCSAISFREILNSLFKFLHCTLTNEPRSQDGFS